jgi:UDPglucose 6-dehydrogenase
MIHHVSVIGTGYLGVTHAVCLAELGHEVIGIDADPVKVAKLAAGRPTFYEPGLADLLERHTASGRLRFSTDPAAAAAFADVHFLCVGTPQRSDGPAADTSYLMAAVDQLVPHLSRPALIVGKSTVPAGTGHLIAERASARARPGVEVEVAWNPEFLREGYAVEDTLTPDRIVLGVSSAEAEKVLRDIYRLLLDDGVPLVVSDVVTAELTKLSANAFLATKISFANAVAELCEAAGGDVLAVTEALGHDTRIGPRFLNAGLGFGGGCLPKDLRAMMANADELGVRTTSALFGMVESVNQRCRRRLVDLAVEQCGSALLDSRVGVLGAAFKPGTDDVRDSPALDVAVQLQARGARVSVYDPQANANAAALHPELEYADAMREALRDADLVLHLTEWREFLEADPAELRCLVREPRIVDGRNALDADRWRAAGWSYLGLGRPGTGA